MAEKTYTITLTETERERVAAIIGCNIDLNMKPNRDRYIEKKMMDSAMRAEKAIQSDQALLMKILGVKEE